MKTCDVFVGLPAFHMIDPMKKTIVINFDDKTAELLSALQESISSVLYEHGCEVSMIEDHDEATLMEVSVADIGVLEKL